MDRFRLQRVLDYRRQREENCEHTLRQVQLLLQQEETRLAALQTEARARTPADHPPCLRAPLSPAATRLRDPA